MAVARIFALLVLALLAGCSPDEPSGARPRGSEPSATFSGAPSAGTIARLPARVRESSGIVASRREPGAYWTQEDGGNPNALHAFDAEGRRGTWTVPGATNVDWEAIAAGPGPEGGRGYLYVGDIGDNDAGREDVVVYRVPEPDPFSDGAATEPPEAFRFTFPGGPRDAEAMMVHPRSGDLYILSKGFTSLVYAARAPLRSGQLEPVGALRGRTSVPGPTGGDISPDGRSVALATYLGAYELTVPRRAGFDSIWSRRDRPLRVPVAIQREAIAYTLDGSGVVTTSEGRRTEVHLTPR